ncbi:MAG: hypothetical protein Q9222_002778 [Ikaeria aurantiellina]
MASHLSTLLTLEQVTLAKNDVLPLVPSSRRDEVSAALESKRRISDACAILSSDDRAATGVEASKRLNLITSLDELTAGDYDLGSFYWSDPACTTTTDVADRYTSSLQKNCQNLTYFQTRIWELEPTRVFWDIVRSGTLRVAWEPDKDSVLQVCTTAIAQNFKLGKDPIDDLFTKPEYKSAWANGHYSAQEVFRRIYRFALVVRVPHDVTFLYNAGMSSAGSIAESPRDIFLMAVGAAGMRDDHAVAIHDYCLTIELRNEQWWTALLTSRSNWAPAAIAAADKTSTLPATALPKQIINYSNMFGGINVGQCEDCSSVTGPAAYFVDLLRMLKNARSDPQTVNSPSLLDKLFARRPDLRTIQLSCANVNTLLPYVDLVNEVMESFIQNLPSVTAAGVVPVQAFNVDEQDRSESLLAQPQNINAAVYTGVIAKQVFPPNIFPYNQGIDTMRCYLDALGSSRYEIMSLFASVESLNVTQAAPSSQAYKSGEKVVAYALAAERLGLQPDDFVAITGDSIYPQDYYLTNISDYLPRETYDAMIGLKTAAQYWGCADSKQLLSETNGISLVADQLLPRADISFQDLVDVLKTRYLSGKLALENPGNTPIWSGIVTDLRLRHPMMGSGNASQTPLDEYDYFCLQAFLRLWRKSLLSLEELDLALSYFTRLPSGYNPPTGLRTIDSPVVEALAAIVQLKDTTGFSIEALMPFYGLMDRWGDRSLYAKLFLQGKADQSDPVFGKNSNGCYLDDEALKLSIYQDILASALNIQNEHWSSILLAGDITDDTLNLSNLSIIYRISLFCKILGITPFQYSAFVSLFGKGYSPFNSPQTTLDAISSWRACEKAEFGIDQVLYITGNDALVKIAATEDKPPVRDLVAAASNILKGLIAIYRELPLVDPTATSAATADDVLKVSSLNFEPATATEVADFIEVPTSGKVDVYNNVLGPYFVQNSAEAESKLLDFSQPSGTAELIAVTLETRAITRRVLFLQAIVPALRARLIDEMILEATNPFFPDTDVSIVRQLLSEGIRIGDGQQPALRDLNNLLTTNDAALKTKSVQAYFVPPSTDLTLSVFLHIVSAALRATALIDNGRLSLGEIVYMQQLASDKCLAINLAAINYKNVRTIQQYTKLRDQVSASSLGLLDFLRWADGSFHSELDPLAQRLSRTMDIPVDAVEQYVEGKFPGVPEAMRIKIFQDIGELENLATAWTTLARLAVPGLRFSSLFRWAKPALPTTTASSVADYDFANASELRGLVKPLSIAGGEDGVLAKANDTLRINQRRALSSFLLQQNFMRSRQIYDEGSLFEFFLIDVQMGARLQTSRLKQATSSVQLYIQRCSLGLEKSQGVSGGVINLERWDWMKKYRVWEATRKVFLYPENWLEPTLRDDKSATFRMLEESILQANLSSSNIKDQIRSYLYATSEVADLDHLTYLWDSVGTYSGTFHIFSRTRHAPYMCYYRSVEISADPAPKVFWQPWSKIEVEIPTVETNWDGKALAEPGVYLVPALYGRRLFLFLPQLTIKTSTDLSSESTFQQLEGRSTQAGAPGKYWQVQMGWTEYRNGSWSPKQLSQKSLSVTGSRPSDWQVQGRPEAAPSQYNQDTWGGAAVQPHATRFRFRARSRLMAVEGSSLPILVLDVERWFPADNDYIYPLGRFEMRGQQLVLGDPQHPDLPMVPPFSPTMRTVFGKQTQQIQSGYFPYTPNYPTSFCGQNVVPTYGLADYAFASTTYNILYLLSFEEMRSDKPTALVQDIATADEITAHFTYPRVNDGANYDSDQLVNKMMPRLLDASTTSESLDRVFQILGEVPTTARSAVFGKRNGPWHELSNPNAVYNWELGVHAIMLLMERLQATQQFDLALEIAHYVFDPTVNGTSMDRCWRFLPFKDIAQAPIATTESILASLTPSSGAENEMQVGVLEWRKNPFTAHAIARSRPSAYMKRIVMKYIEILIASGDDYFRQNTLETVPFAIQRYVEASHVFGTAPKKTPKLTRTKPASYADLEQSLNDFSNSSFDMELDFPYYSNPDKRGQAEIDSPYPLTGLLRSTYFCVPTNPKLLELGALIDDRLYKIRNSQDINGVSRRLSLYEPPLDLGMIGRAVAQGISLPSLLNDSIGPMPNFRFTGLLEKAMEMCGELKAIAGTFVAVRETRDAEALGALQSRQDSLMQNMAIDLKLLARKEIEKSLDELLETRKGQASRLEYYLALTGDDTKTVPDPGSGWDDIVQSIEKPSTDDLRLTTNESLELAKNDSASGLNVKAIALDSLAMLIRSIPDIGTEIAPLGMGCSIGAVTVNISDALTMGAGIMRADAQRDADIGARAARKAELVQQLQDRRMEANAAGRDIKITDRQIETMQVRLDICDEDLKQQKQMVANATQVNEFLKTKYTSEQLYAWMESQVRGVFYQTYLLANDLAKKAQKAYRFERVVDSTEYIGQGYWDSSRDGLMSGENLYLALKRLEAAYLDRRGHDFEMTKNISLRQVQPLALCALRETGMAEFSLPEVLFDFDLPGHYLRRIKTANISLVSATDLGTDVNTTVTLLEHAYRVSPAATSGQDYKRKTGEVDDRFRTDQIPMSSIATSQPSQDSGVFDYQLEFIDQQRFVPFEGAGVISKWRLELPMPIRQFDYNAIDDVVLQIKYTANAGGARFRRAASEAARIWQTTSPTLANYPFTEGQFLVIDIEKDYPDEWAQLITPPFTAIRYATLPGVSSRCPFYTKGCNLGVVMVLAFIKVENPGNIAWPTNLSLRGRNYVTWNSQPDVGASKVLKATTNNETFTDWQVGLSVAAGNAKPQRIVFVIKWWMAP